jgi:hypothetical protein
MQDPVSKKQTEGGRGRERERERERGKRSHQTGIVRAGITKEKRWDLLPNERLRKTEKTGSLSRWGKYKTLGKKIK